MASKFLALLLVVVAVEARVTYRNHKVLRVPVITRDQADVISQLEQEGIDVWSMVIGREAHLRVAPWEMERVNTTLNEVGMFATVGIHDVQQLIDEEQQVIAEADKERGRATWIGKSFVRYSEIVAWINALPSNCGGKCSVTKVGKSYESRDIYVIRISNNIAQSGTRQVIFLEANIHAREWLSHATLAYIIQTMLDQYGTNAKITAALTNFEWHFIVVSNPDGYEYSWTNDRLWRKTRSRNGVCYGVDPNRNFDSYHCGEGTSSSSCSDIYCGPSPFSEAETKVIRDYTTSIKSRMVVFQSVHSYAQMIMLPFAYTMNAYPSDFTELSRVVRAMADAVYQTSRKIYSTGNVADLLNPAAGSSMDWVRQALNTKYVMAWELRPTQNTPNGFVVNPSEIIPAGNEVLQALLTMVETIRL